MSKGTYWTTFSLLEHSFCNSLLPFWWQLRSLEPLWPPLGTAWAPLTTHRCKWLDSFPPKAHFSTSLGAIEEQSFDQIGWFLVIAMLPKASPQSWASFVVLFTNSSDTGTLILELPCGKSMEYTTYYITSFFLATQTYPPCVNVPSLMGWADGLNSCHA